MNCTIRVAKTKALISFAVLPMRKTKARISSAVTAQPISAFVFATPTVQFLFFFIMTKL